MFIACFVSAMWVLFCIKETSEGKFHSYFVGVFDKKEDAEAMIKRFGKPRCDFLIKEAETGVTYDYSWSNEFDMCMKLTDILS